MKQAPPENGLRNPKPMRVRSLFPVIRAAGLVPWAVVFMLLYLIAVVVVWLVEPHINSFGDSSWLMFQVVTTIGLGDFSCTTMLGRAMAILLSAYSVFFLALITGVVVSYCTERMRYRRDASVAYFLDQLEHLPELSREELVEISEKVKRL